MHEKHPSRILSDAHYPLYKSPRHLIFSSSVRIWDNLIHGYGPT